MANPMQRRAKNAFLLGILVATAVMAVVVGLLIYNLTTVNEKMEEIEAKQKFVFVAASDLEPETEIVEGTLMRQQVITTVNDANFVDDSVIYIKTEGLTPEENETEEEVAIYKTKIKIAAGTIVTKDMIYTDGEGIAKDERLQEYNTISLPSQLQNGDYVDIRFRLATGEDFVVLTKKKVEGTNTDTIWLKVNEEEILTLNSAIVENWMLTGSKLYAIEYTDPANQEKATITYPINADVLKQIEITPNMLGKAKDELYKRYNVDQRNKIEAGIQAVEYDDRVDLLEEGIKAELERKKELREEYVTSLEGTELVGYTKE